MEINNILILSSLTKFNTANYLISSFKRYVNKVFVYSDVNSINADLYGKGFVSLRKILNKTPFYPELIFFIEGGTMQLFPYDLENVTCLTAWYGIDTHMDYKKHLQIAKGFDVSFIAQKQYVSSLKSDGIKNVFWLPLGFDQELHALKYPKKKYDIAYVGGLSKKHNKSRFELIELIKINFQNCKLFFGSAEPKKMAEIYSQSWIVFNKSIKNDINMRVFESTASESLLFTDKIINNGWSDLFKDKPFVIYENKNELINQLKFHLDNKNIINLKIKSILENFKDDHSYDQRVMSMLNIINKIEKVNIKTGFTYYLSLLYKLNLKKDIIEFLLRKIFK